MDVLSAPLTGRMAGSSKGLAFILGAEGAKEQSQRERDAICLSLDGLRKAAALSCALGGSTRHTTRCRRRLGLVGDAGGGQGGRGLRPVSTSYQHVRPLKATSGNFIGTFVAAVTGSEDLFSLF